MVSQAPKEEPPQADEQLHKNEGNSGVQHITKNESIEEDIAELNFDITSEVPNDPVSVRNSEIIANSTPATDLEIALKAELGRQIEHNEKLAGEVTKLRGFIAKRKQTYKRKRKDESAPRKKLSGYNLFVRERFARLAKQNEEALKSLDNGAELRRVPPASGIASSGHAWSQLSAEEKARYNEMAKPDEDRFEKETANYQAPERLNRKRNKTGYNVFFSHHVLKLKREEGSVPAERGSVARIVGDAWKKMSAEEKDDYERQADKANAETDPVEIQLQPPQPMNPTGPPPEQMPPPMMEHPMNDGGPPPHGPDPNMPPPGMPPPYPPDYGMHGPPPPVIHHPPGYDGYYGAPPPPFDPYAYPPPPYPPYGPQPPPGEAMPPYGPPPPNYPMPPYA
ncbi:hypothetical protein ACHAXR_010711 [Thalassiosira sp. AJA248-18]